MITNVSRLLMDYNNDVDRIMYIFSEESSKSEETVLFWRRGIEAYCNDEGTFLFTPLELSLKFIHREMVPTSIDNSLAILRSRKEVADKDYLVNRTMFETIANSASGWVGSLFTTLEMNNKISNAKGMTSETAVSGRVLNSSPKARPATTPNNRGRRLASVSAASDATT